MRIGFIEFVIIAVVFLLFNGPRVGRAARAIGQGIRGYKESVKDNERDVTPLDEHHP